MWNSLPCYVKKIFRTLLTAGIKPYIVGGAVRNFILDIPVTDYDITSSATPEQVIKALKNYTVVKTGIKHGTVTVLTPDGSVEHTTFRTESGYTDHRRPQNINYSNNLMEDLSRRDFTFNSIAYSKNSDFIDPFNGISDLQFKLVKCVGEPENRFEEDALRILRALRFSSVLQFELDYKTHTALLENQNGLKYISKERITAEFCKLICGKNAGAVLLKYKSVVEIVWPEVITESYNEALAKMLNTLPEDPHLRLTAIAAHCLKKYYNKNFAHAISTIVQGRFALPTKAVEQIGRVAYLANTELPTYKNEVKKLLRTYDMESFKHALIIKKAQHSASHLELNLRSITECEKCLDEIEQNGECYNLAGLALKGEDLIALGISPGPFLGRVLYKLLDLVVEETLPNTKNALSNYAKTHCTL